MEKIIIPPALFILALCVVCLTIGVQTVEGQYTQDGKGFPIASPITILSPSNTTYNSSLLSLNVTSKFLLKPNFATFNYSLDGENNVSLPIEATFVPIEALRTYANGTTEKSISIFSYHRLNGHVALPELSEGSHSLTMFAEYKANNVTGLDSRTVHFTINGVRPPIVSNLSIQNKTYDSVEIPLDFNVNEPECRLCYELDGAVVEINANTTLAGLPSGSHNLIVYATNSAGNTGASEAVLFRTADPWSRVLGVAISGAFVGVILAVCILVYGKKRKHSTNLSLILAKTSPAEQQHRNLIDTCQNITYRR